MKFSRHDKIWLIMCALYFFSGLLWGAIIWGPFS